MFSVFRYVHEICYRQITHEIDGEIEQHRPDSMEVRQNHARECIEHEEDLDEGRSGVGLIALVSPFIALRTDVVFWRPLEKAPGFNESTHNGERASRR